MEKRGADVTCFDLSDKDDWDIVPLKGKIDKNIFLSKKESKRKINNSFLLAHHLLKSNAKMIYGNIYNLPEDIGPFDISFLGSILLHLLDPFLAIQKVASITNEIIIVTDEALPCFIEYSDNLLSKIKCKSKIFLYYFNEYLQIRPIIFAPNPNKQQQTIWWYFSPKIISRFLQILGFSIISISYHYQKFLSRSTNVLFYTVIGQKK